MVAHVVENVAVQTKQRPSAVVTYILPYYDVRRKEQAKWFAEPEVFPQAQRTSLLVVLANVTAYNPATDVRRTRPARVFVTPEATIVTKSWQTAPFGAVGYNGDVQRWPQAKFFAEPQVFAQPQRLSPRAVTDYSQGSSDIFHGMDTYGWPPPPVPEYWSPESRGTRTILQNFTTYDFAHDIIGRRPQSKQFDEPATFWKFGQAPTLNALNFLYNAAADITRLKPQVRYFEDAAVFWRQSQPVTINAITAFTVYNAATDVTRLRRQAQYFEQAATFIRPVPPPFVVLGSPVITGFRCRAVTAGTYGGLYYLPGDVFDILFAHDFSDATKNYQIGGNEYAAGWMLQVPSTTPLFQTVTSQIYPMFPPIDPNRRFVM